MEYKVEVFNRGDMALEVHNGQHDQVLQPGDRVTFDASEGLGIGPAPVATPEPEEPTMGPTDGGVADAVVGTNGQSDAPVTEEDNNL